VRCSSCEPLLDGYLETTLRPAQSRQVAAHLRTCSGCAALFGELRVIDALLHTASPPAAFDPGFTAGVLEAAESAAGPPRLIPRRLPFWVSLLVYLGVAWIAAAFAFARRHDLQSPLAALWQMQVHGLATFAAVVRTLAPATPFAAAAVTAVLIVDLLLLCAMFYGYRHLRPRLAGYLAKGPRP
jgi:anti-sigma factor RsiW